MPQTLFVGIDISSKENVAQFLGDDGKPVRSSFTFANNRPGLQEFLALVAKTAAKARANTIKIGLESTGVYWWHIEEALWNHSPLERWKVRLYCINPKIVKAFKATFKRLPKTDSVDAYVIAQRVRFGELSPKIPMDPRYQALSRLTRLHYSMKSAIVADKHRLCQHAFLKFSTYAETVGDRFFTNGALQLLDQYTTGEIAQMPIDELLSVLLEHTNNRFKEPERFVKEIQKASRRAYRLNPNMEDAVSLTLTMLLENIRYMESQCSRLDKLIVRQLRAIPQTLDSIPGIGPVLASGIIAEIGQTHRFANHSSLASFAGLVWHKYQSGDFTAEETSLVKRGNKYLRYYLVEAANSVRVHCPEYREYYQRKYMETTKHRHKRALVLTARKLVRLVFALLSKGQIYKTGSDQ